MSVSSLYLLFIQLGVGTAGLLGTTGQLEPCEPPAALKMSELKHFVKNLGQRVTLSFQHK